MFRNSFALMAGLLPLLHGVALAQIPAFENAFLLTGTSSNERVASITTDGSGNLYITGFYRDTVDFDPGPGTFNLTNSSDVDSYVCKLDSAANLLWVKSIGATVSLYSRSIVVDGSGNVYTAGTYEGTADFDPGPGTFNLTNSDSTDCFVLKLDSAGNFLWVKSVGTTLGISMPSITVDDSGNVYTTGIYRGTGDFNPGPGTFNLTNSSGIDSFVFKLNSAGNFAWACSFGSTGYGAESWAIATDSSGNVYFTGNFTLSGDFNPGAGVFTLTSAGGRDIFVSKLDTNGNFLWAGRMGGPNGDHSRSIAVDGSGNVYTTGLFQTTADFDPGLGVENLTTPGSTVHVFVSKLDSAGNFTWARQLGGSFYANGKAIAVDDSGGVYTAGTFRGTVDFDPGAGAFELTSVSDSDTDVFVSYLDADGNFLGAGRMGNGNEETVESIATDGSGNVYTTGLFRSTLDFDPGPGFFDLKASGGSDVFVSKLGPPLPPLPAAHTKTLLLTMLALALCIAYTLRHRRKQAR